MPKGLHFMSLGGATSTHVSYRAQYGINACRFLFFVQSFGNLLLARETDLFRHYEMIHLSAILKLRSETR